MKWTWSVICGNQTCTLANVGRRWPESYEGNMPLVMLRIHYAIFVLA